MADIFDLFKKIESDRNASATQNAPITHLIVGLGNPGAEYVHTRHNAGFLTLEYLRQQKNLRIDRAKYKALVGEATIGGVRALLMLPQTFMNASGEAVRAAADFYKIPASNIIVVCDDISLEVGRLRVRGKGSDGGQRGVRSIITELGRDDFPRIKIGVGQKPHPDYDLAAWVLSNFTPTEQKALFSAFPTACRGIELLLAGKLDDAMQVCNGFRPEENA
ncbi:MAG: aminoacyl-tRNA hydrolase [Clostridia bacterium]|nr:aminoacyl-tRNA hydrolase [Clostridia bacterium]